MKQEHSETYRKLRFNITYARKMQGLSQLQLAEKVGISRTHMSNIEAPNVEKSLSLSKLFDIADVLGVLPHKLLEFKD